MIVPLSTPNRSTMLLIVIDELGLLLVQRRGRGDRPAGERRRCLGEQPGAAQHGSSDHHPVNRPEPEGLDDRVGGPEIAISDQGDLAEVFLDGSDPLPIGSSAEHLPGRSPVNGEGGSTGRFDRPPPPRRR